MRKHQLMNIQFTQNYFSFIEIWRKIDTPLLNDTQYSNWFFLMLIVICIEFLSSVLIFKLSLVITFPVKYNCNFEYCHLEDPESLIRIDWFIILYEYNCLQWICCFNLLWSAFSTFYVNLLQQKIFFSKSSFLFVYSTPILSFLHSFISWDT